MVLTADTPLMVTEVQGEQAIGTPTERLTRNRTPPTRMHRVRKWRPLPTTRAVQTQKDTTDDSQVLPRRENRPLSVAHNRIVSTIKDTGRGILRSTTRDTGNHTAKGMARRTTKDITQQWDRERSTRTLQGIKTNRAIPEPLVQGPMETRLIQDPGTRTIRATDVGTIRATTVVIDIDLVDVFLI